MEKGAKIFVAGHRGLVGSAIARHLRSMGWTNLIERSHTELDLMDSQKVKSFFESESPEYVFLAAAVVGGIVANDSFPANFIHNNLAIQNNVIDCSYRCGVKKLVFLGSSCIYPKHCPQPMKEEYLLTGPLEETNEWYAIAKIAGVKMCQAYRKQYGFNCISLMPTNLYGPNDNYDLNTGHVLPALMRKFHEAKQLNSKEVIVWGTGKPKREFLHVDDLASASVFLMEKYDSSEILNIGTGEDISINDLALLIARIVGYAGNIKFDSTKPDGTPRKLLSVEKLSEIGWKSSIDLEEGISLAYKDYLQIIRT